MAITENTFNGTGSYPGPFQFTFNWLNTSDIKVSVGGVLKTAGVHYDLQNLNFTTKQGGEVLFTAGNAPGAGTGNIRVYRETPDTSLVATFSSGSAIRASDLNQDFTQILHISQETANFASNTDAASIEAVANTALSNSNTAIATAENAEDIANAISSTANTALSNSTSAVTTANSAVTTANAAQSTANAAMPLAGGTFIGDVTLNAQNDLRFADADSSNWVALQAPTTVASNITWSLPDADGTNGQVLRTDGSGNLSWLTLTSGGDVFLTASNALTGANTFTNATGQTFRQAATQDGILLRGRAGGTTSRSVEIVPATLTASRVLTAPDVTGTLVTTGDTGSVTNTMLAGSIALSKLATGALPTAITIASANIVDGTIVNGDISASAAIAGTKISPDFGSQAVTTTSTNTAASFNPTGSTVPANGLYRPAADTLSLSTASSSRLTITNTGTIYTGGTSSGASSLNGLLAAIGYASRSGQSGSFGANIFNLFWATGNVAQLWVDTSNLGTISVSSDYRIKRNVKSIEAPCIERIKRLRPVEYQIADYGNLFKADGLVREGFIAHEVQEVIPSGAEGQKDEENRIQNLRTDAIVAVLTKALQEAIARIEILESQINPTT